VTPAGLEVHVKLMPLLILMKQDIAVHAAARRLRPPGRSQQKVVEGSPALAIPPLPQQQDPRQGRETPAISDQNWQLEYLT